MNQKNSEEKSIGKVIGLTTLAVGVLLVIYMMRYF
jgi:hypothetical protein